MINKYYEINLDPSCMADGNKGMLIATFGDTVKTKTVYTHAGIVNATPVEILGEISIDLFEKFMEPTLPIPFKITNI